MLFPRRTTLCSGVLFLLSRMCRSGSATPFSVQTLRPHLKNATHRHRPLPKRSLERRHQKTNVHTTRTFSCRFRSGALHITRNFPTIFWNLTRRAIVSQLVLLSVLGCCRMISPDFYVNFLDLFSNVLQNIALRAATLSEQFQKATTMALVICCLPVSVAITILLSMYAAIFLMLPLLLALLLSRLDFCNEAIWVAWGVKVVLLKPMTTWLWLLQKAECYLNIILDGNKKDPSSRISNTKLVFLAVYQVALSGPLFEELLFRLIPDRFEKAFIQRTRNSTQHGSTAGPQHSKIPDRGSSSRSNRGSRELSQSARTPVEKRRDPNKWFGRYRTVHLASSILFAAMHIPIQTTDSSSSSSSVAGWILVAGGRFTAALFGALDYLIPLFENEGFAASLGGHMTWNLILASLVAILLFICHFVHLPVIN